jgi:hypothetical protein
MSVTLGSRRAGSSWASDWSTRKRRLPTIWVNSLRSAGVSGPSAMDCSLVSSSLA